ncbi:hypothetical protein T12_1745 [Trichinella patagoniensis]|uniref:Uncharacterized protein n=1 Tax=Trichinella patagoniensis TaxID=990121 RepID=A0A0V0ZQ44_9BILA|nr:hypothetical protein T12_1745 [Trichinella patagoniensis]
MQLALRNRCFRTRSNALLPRGFLDTLQRSLERQAHGLVAQLHQSRTLSYIQTRPLVLPAVHRVEETMRSLIQMVCLAAYATRHGSTVCCMAHDPCFCPSRLTAVEEQGSGTLRVWAVLKWHLRVTCLTKEQWELNYDHDVLEIQFGLLQAKFLPTFLPGYLSLYIGSIHINVPL